MKITVVGKAHLEGTSRRTGNPYNFNQVHFLGYARGVEGQAAQTISLDPQIIPYESIEVGARYNADFDQRGYCIGFDRIDHAGAGDN